MPSAGVASPRCSCRRRRSCPSLGRGSWRRSRDPEEDPASAARDGGHYGASPAPLAEAVLADRQLEVLPHLEAAEHGSDAKADRVLAVKRALLAFRRDGDLLELELRGSEQLLALPRALLGEGDVLAGNESLAGKARRRDLGEFQFVEERQL